jgi:hypothetical protein
MVHLLIHQYPRRRHCLAWYKSRHQLVVYIGWLTWIKQWAVLFNNWIVRFFACFLLLCVEVRLNQNLRFWMCMLGEQFRDACEVQQEAWKCFVTSEHLRHLRFSTPNTSKVQSASAFGTCTCSRVTVQAWRSVWIIAVGAYDSVAASGTACSVRGFSFNLLPLGTDTS